MSTETEVKERLKSTLVIVQNDEQSINIEGKNRIKECPECGSKNLVNDYNKAEIYCADCGLVIAENLVDLGPEWRSFDSEQTRRRERAGAPMTYRIHDKGLSTISSKGWTSKEWRPRHPRLQWQNQTNKERSLIFALSEIDRISSTLKLSEDIREQASMLYRKAMKRKLIQGRSIEGITTALLYIVCRQYGVPRTLEEVREISRVGQKEMNRAYRFLLRELDLKVSPASPIEFVPRFCSILNLSEETRSYTIEIIKNAIEAKLTNGRSPIGTAAAAIYIAAILNNQHQTQKNVANACGVTEVTIRNRYKEISEGLNIDVLL